MNIEEIIKENQELKLQIDELKEKLKIYTNPESCQKFYEKNKEQIIKKSNERLKKLRETDPERLKEYRHKAYLKRKDKLKSKNL